MIAAPYPRVIKRAQGLQMLNLSRQTAWRHRNDPHMPQPFRLGARWVYLEDELVRWLRERAAGQLVPQHMQEAGAADRRTA
jgi:predicted DNA-binding transcriptional regulator AlpA